MRSSNPVLTRLTPETQSGQVSGYGSPYQPSPSPVTYVAENDRMTIDDVVVRTVGLLGLTGLAGIAMAWAFTAGIISIDLLGPVWIVAAIAGLVVGLIISFKRITNPPLILAYAVIEGVFVGAVSKYYSMYWDGIVLQAAVCTFGIFFVMAMLYKFRIIRNSPKFARGVVGAMIGILGVIVANWVLSLFGVTTGLRGDQQGNGSWLAIGFSILVIVVASLTFILDFDLIEQSVAQGAPKAMAWTCAFGLLVGLIWVYLEVLRLLSYLRGRN